MSRSLKVAPECIPQVKLALKRNRFPSQTALAQELGLAYATVSKFLNGKPVDYLNFVEISEKLGLDWQALARIDDSSTAIQHGSPSKTPQDAENLLSLTRFENIPLNVAVDFVGRDESLSQLHQLLQENDQVAIAAIAGMGGVGKTELAIQYAKQHLDDYPGGVCWLFAVGAGLRKSSLTHPDIDQPAVMDVGLQVVEFAKAHFFNFTIPDGLSLAAQVKFCWEHWQTPPEQERLQGGVLVVLDDVADEEQVKDYLPPVRSRFKVLMTTRLQGLVPASQQLSLDVLTPPAALELLASRIGKNRLNDTRGKGFVVGAKRQQVAEQLCEWLGYLPLGLELVGRYLEQQPDLSLEKMLLRLHKQRLSHQSLIRDEDDPTWNLTAQRGVAAAFELSWQLLNEDAQELGFLLSVFALAPIPWAQVESVLGQLYLPGALLGKLLNGSHSDSEAEIENLIEALQEDWERRRTALVRLHLLQRTDEETYRLHQLIRVFLREKLAQLDLPNPADKGGQGEDLKRAFCQVMVAVAKQIPDSPTRELIEEVTPAMPHVAETAIALKDFLSDEDLIWPFSGLGRFYQGQGLYNLAAPWFEQCLEVVRTRLGDEHSHVATSLNNVAELYRTQGRYSEAEPLSKTPEG